MVILGLSPIVHESAVGLIVDGKLVAAAAEERFSRIKSDGAFPHRALAYVLERAGLSQTDVDHVAYAALPFSRERLRDVVGYARNVAYVAQASDRAATKLAHLLNYTRSLVLHREWTTWGGTERRLRRELEKWNLADKMVFVDHHRAHVASAYYTSGFDRCLAVSLDGYGSGQAGSFYLAEGGKLTLLSAIPYPHSLGTFYRRVTQALGFQANRHEGKVVGLAAFGDSSKLYAEVRARFDLDHEDYYRFKSAAEPWAEKRLAAAHTPADIAAAYQRVLEDVAVLFVSKWVHRTGVKNVVCAGGVFANVKMNQRIAEIPEVERLFVFPAMGDGGVGVGAALALQADLYGMEPYPLPHVYLGPSYDDARIERALAASGFPYRRSAGIEEDIVEHLVARRVVARFDGPMEFGPRALGNRSILYSAAEPSVNKWLNRQLKRTEFMPFAPATLDERAAELYEDVDVVRDAARFMTVTANCSPRMRAESPAAVHVDGTARPQLVTEHVNPSLHRVLTLYERRTGVPTLINTSYNMHEEPIVCSPEDALRAFKESELDVLAIGHYLVEFNRAA